MGVIILILFILILFFGIKIQLADITIEIYPFKRFLQLKCNPPNITHCKKVIYEDFNCKSCKYFNKQSILKLKK